MSPEVLKQFLVRQGRWLTSSHQSRLCLQESMDANTALKARLTLLKGYRLLKVALYHLHTSIECSFYMLNII